MQNPVVLVPGITASTLVDRYPVDPETVWSAVFDKSWDRVALHPDDLRYERDEPARVTEGGMFELMYAELAKELRHDLSPKADQPTPVYPFAYDWRQPLESLEDRLLAFVDEVIDRTKLLRHYHKAGYADAPKVDLVAHSMGGLLVAGMLARHGKRVRVGRIATLGTPFRGSLEAVLKMTTGLAALGGTSSSSREREVARLTPALYYLLPDFAGALEPKPGVGDLPKSFFEPEAWQPGIVQTIAEYVRLHGVAPADRKQQAQDLFAALLHQAHTHRRRVCGLDLAQAGLASSDWLCIVGVGETTRVRLRVGREHGKPSFDLTSEDRMNTWEEPPSKDRALTGDGTVPYRGAQPPFLPPESLVCVCDGDFGYWELRDRVLELGVGLHGALPKMNLVHRLVASHFQGVQRKGTWGRRPPDLAPGASWTPPIAGLEAKG